MKRTEVVEKERLITEAMRVWAILEATQPGTDLYHELVSEFDHLVWQVERLEETPVEPTVVYTEPEPKKEEPVKEEPKPVETPVKEEPAPVEKPEESPVTKEFVRELLVKARDTGAVDINALIAKYTPEGKKLAFSSIPTSRYAELVKELDQYAR